MDSSIPKAEKKMKMLSEKVGASDEGVLWLKETLDPFSDTPRRPVGFPDLITGNSVMQVVKQSQTIKTDSTNAQDVHVFLDTVDSAVFLCPNAIYASNPGLYGNAENVTSANINSAVKRGGIVVRASTVGEDLGLENTIATIPLPANYTNGGTTRVIAKGFEVHNTTNKLNVGGAVTVYRDTGPTPYATSEAVTLFSRDNANVNITHQGHALSKVPINLAMVTNIPGSQQWDAEDGCYIVAAMSSQTNNPADESDFLVFDKEDAAPGVVWSNAVSDGVTPPLLAGNAEGKLTSPFFLCGAYFTGLPPGSSLTINVIYLIERFVNASNLDLVVLAQPSPFYDPVAMEIYSKTAMRLPHGVKVSSNSDGDWIKCVADVLGSFGVPGMPIVKGAVDVYNTVIGGRPKKDKENEKDKRIRELEDRLNRMNGAQMIPRGVVVEGVRSKSNIQAKPKPKPKPKVVPSANSSKPLALKAQAGKGPTTAVAKRR